MNICRIISALSGILMISSCIGYHIDSYPASYPPVLHVKNMCQAIIGSYEDADHPGPNSSLYVSAHLSEYVFETGTPLVKPYPDRVQFSQAAGGSLEIKALRGSKIVARATYSEASGTLSCSDGAAEITANVGPPHTDHEALFLANYHPVFLRRAEDGSLVVEQIVRQVGSLLLFFPFAGEHNDFYKFSPLGSD